MPCDKDFGYVTLIQEPENIMVIYNLIAKLTCVKMLETTPEDHLIILFEFLVGNTAHATSSSIQDWVNCLRVRV